VFVIDSRCKHEDRYGSVLSLNSALQGGVGGAVTFCGTSILNLPYYFIHTIRINYGFLKFYLWGSAERASLCCKVPRLRPHVLLTVVLWTHWSQNGDEW